jgi:ligand-binding SRPBCC domain-containing protein
MRHHFTSSQWVPYSRATVFRFFANPANLPPLMPRWQAARIDRIDIVPPPGESPSSAVAGLSSTMRISFRPVPLSPIRQTWHAIISEFARDEHFCDEQQSGPFAYWKHCHRLRDESRNGVSGTLLTDDVVYEIKLGVLGELAHSLFLARQIQNLFRHRQQQLEKLLAASTS